MALVDLRDLLAQAVEHGCSIAVVELDRLDVLGATVAAAEAVEAPLIVSIAESGLPAHDFEPAMAAAVAAVRRATVPMAILGDRVDSPEAAVRAINLGAMAIGIEPDTREHDPTAWVRAIAAPARACGVAVARVLGSGEDPQSLADGDADFLVVAAGAIAEVAQRMQGRRRIPLIARPDDRGPRRSWSELRALGVAAIACRCPPDAGRDEIRTDMEILLRHSGAAGQARELLQEVRPWQTVEHLIIYNVQGVDEAGAEAMIREGREVLARIPGVRRVASGRAVADGARYRFCWVIEFTDRAVIDSYRDHPLHVAFADRLFRPVAGDRISIDYLLTE